jgi:hypothetical protein
VPSDKRKDTKKDRWLGFRRRPASSSASAEPSAGETFLMETIETKEPRAHTANIRGEFRELIQHLRDDVKRVEEPKARALFETAAEVITGLDTAFQHYEEKREAAWK